MGGVFKDTAVGGCVPSLMRPKGRNSNHKTNLKMETQKVIPIEERAEVIQDVIDRLLYLTSAEVKMYREALENLNERFPIDVTIDESGLRIYPLNKNLQ